MVEQLGALGVRVAGYVADVSDIRAHGRLLGDVEAELGPLTTLVNNAGVQRPGPGRYAGRFPGKLRPVPFGEHARSILPEDLRPFVRRSLSRDREPGAHYSIVNISSANAIAEERREFNTACRKPPCP